jgi:hypothetical protein
MVFQAGNQFLLHETAAKDGAPGRRSLSVVPGGSAPTPIPLADLPPTVALTNRAFGEQRGPIVFGWVVVGHQLGAAVAAFGAGLVRQELGTYSPAFFAAGAFAVLAGFAVLMLPSVPRRVDAAAFEPECAAA